MESWRSLDEIEELRALRTAAIPPIPLEISGNPLNCPLANRWLRFFARIFDLMWEILCISFFFLATVDYYPMWLLEWFVGSGLSKALVIFFVPIALIFDAVVYRLFENTPGKSMLGLKVGLLDATPLSFSQYLRRNLTLCASGLAFGIPVIFLFTAAVQARRLGRGQQASYDENTGYRVRSRPTGWVRKFIFAIAFLGLYMSMTVLNHIG